MKLDSVNELLKLSTRQWSQYFRDTESWMVNFFSIEDVPDSEKWQRLSSLGNLIVQKGLSKCQRNRSFSLS